MYLLKTISYALGLVLLLSACESYNNVVDPLPPSPSFSGDIVDNIGWYKDQSKEVTTENILLSASPSSSLCAPHDDKQGPLRPCTLEDIENDTNAFDDYAPQMSVIFSAPAFPSMNEQTNSLLKQKGKSTRSAPQKSYKIKLDSKTVLYMDQRRLQYNKQTYDLTRIRNKLSFDLFQEIPNFTSLRTEFVHLFLDKEDKGLYTRVESYDKEYLLHRGYNKDDNLYKAQHFLFYKHPSLVLNNEGVPVDKVAFEKIIEPQRGKEQTKLLEMLRAIENENRDIDSIIFQYFNRNNYLTWLAVNLIMGNVDTISQNFFLLNPLHSDTFYFLPWDYDDAWGWDQQLDQFDTPYYADWQLGIARYWDSPLHKRFLSKLENRKALDVMIQNIRNNYLTDSKVHDKIILYKKLVQPFIESAPDKDYLPRGSKVNVTTVEWNTECDALVDKLALNINNYNTQKGKPMPFWQTFEYKNGIMHLIWDSSIDLENEAITYSVSLGKDSNLTLPLIIDEANLEINSSKLSVTSYGEISYSFTPLVPFVSGEKLYLKVVSKDTQNNTQIAFDKVEDEVTVNQFYHGVYEIVIP